MPVVTFAGALIQNEISRFWMDTDDRTLLFELLDSVKGNKDGVLVSRPHRLEGPMTGKR